MQLTVTAKMLGFIAQSNSYLQKMFSDTLQNINTEDDMNALDNKFNPIPITLPNLSISGSSMIKRQRDEQDDLIDNDIMKSMK
jgi:hypothetical protein